MVQRNDIDIPMFRKAEAFVQLHLVLRPTFRGCTAAGIVNQYLPHQLCRYGNKMRATDAERRPVAYETEKDFVNKFRALQRVIGSLSL